MADGQFPKYSEMILAAILCQDEAGGSTFVEITDFIRLIGVTDDPDFVKREVKRYLKEEIESGFLVLTNNSTKVALKLPKNELASSMAPESPLNAEQPAGNPEPVEPNAERVTHPEYTEMIVEAIKYLREKGGASFVAIIKYITDVYGVSDNLDLVKRRVKVYLKKGVESGAFVMVRKLEEMAVRSPEKAGKLPTNPDSAEPNAG